MDTPGSQDIYRSIGSLRSVAAQVMAMIRLVELDAMAGEWQHYPGGRLYTTEDLECALKDCVVKLQLVRKKLPSRTAVKSTYKGKVGK